MHTNTVLVSMMLLIIALIHSINDALVLLIMIFMIEIHAHTFEFYWFFDENGKKSRVQMLEIDGNKLYWQAVHNHTVAICDNKNTPNKLSPKSWSFTTHKKTKRTNTHAYTNLNKSFNCQIKVVYFLFLDFPFDFFFFFFLFSFSSLSFFVRFANRNWNDRRAE